MTEHITERDAVRNLQRYLRRLSYDTPSIPPVPVDGIFEAQTREALSAFQKSIGLPVTGRADQKTSSLLFAKYEKRKREDQRLSPDLFPSVPRGYETTLGERGAHILLLQFVLDELRVAYDTLPPFSQNGIFDEETSAAVREIQRISGLPLSGRVNRALWNRLSEEYNFYAT